MPTNQARRAVPVLGLVVIGMLGMAGVGYADPSPDVLPGQVTAPETSIDLSHWKLTLPITSEGTFTGPGNAVEVKALAGFGLPPYFVVTPDSLTFEAPTLGAHTSGSHYPRSELREMDGAQHTYDWVLTDGGHMEATLSVDQLPKTSQGKFGKIVIGQIHGPNDELCRLYYDNGLLYFVDDKAGAKLTETKFLLKASSAKVTKIPLKAKFSYVIDANSDRLQVSATFNSVTHTASDPISSFWPDKELYFKAGAYVQVGAPGGKANTVGTGSGVVTFYALTPPSHTIVHAVTTDEPADDDDSSSVPDASASSAPAPDASASSSTP